VVVTPRTRPEQITIVRDRLAEVRAQRSDDLAAVVRLDVLTIAGHGRLHSQFERP
jgi:hypothetical protein